MRDSKNYYVYILTNWNHKVMYIGVTGDLSARMYQHINKQVEGFTKKYNVTRLVYFESTVDVNSALAREKQLKGWARGKKNKLVEGVNPEWNDLASELGMKFD